ncbi:MAG: hypothetical protein NWR63_03350 [OM182 bacterium]|jgi:iron complex outermembrane recepter protein|nr:hypothetical protein [OM182 bacterium]MDP4941117.1 hypothetical protein [OM182 bacterium]MDP5072774.1 hypothetical protein [OM182 bacterium]
MNSKFKLMIAVSAAISLQAGLTNAQSDEAVIEQITVTAQQREQSILDVPVIMDVIQGEFLDRTNTTELDDLSRFLPNVVIQEQGVSLPSFNIRGITDDSASVLDHRRVGEVHDARQPLDSGVVCRQSLR